MTMSVVSENEELARLVDGAYKNILEKFNPCARQLISAGKAYLKALHGAMAASKAYIDTLGKLARHAHQGTWGGCTDIGTALLQLVDVQKDIQSQQLNILKAFYVDLLVPLETNIDKDTKVVICEQKRFAQQHRCLQESYMKAAAVVKKQRKKQRTKVASIDKEIKNLQQLEEEKMRLDSFCEQSLKQAITQERRRYGFVLERQCSMSKHNLVYHSQGQNLLQHHLDEWEEVSRSRESLPDPIDKLFPPTNNYKNISEYACANLLESHSINSLLVPGLNTLRKTRSIDTSCVDLRGGHGLMDTFPRPLVRAKSDFNLASSSASLISNDYGITLRPKNGLLVDSVHQPVPHSRVRALYSYLSSGEHQLSFHEGDIIVLIGDRNKGWQYGENQRNHRRGWFPIAYTAVLDDGPNIHPMEPNCFSSPELMKRRSVDLSSPYSTFGVVSRSFTTPSMGDLPPPPPASHRPLSTFVDSKTAESLQRMRLASEFPDPPPCLPFMSAPSSASALAPSGSLTPVEGRGDGGTLLRPRRLPPLSTSLHSSSDSGFCNEPPPLLLTPPPNATQENVFSSIKLKKVTTNDRSAPMIC